jgi:hypothetical protein
MHDNSTLQSNLLTSRRRVRTGASTSEARERPGTGTEWFAYFQENAARHRPIPWQSASVATAAELAAIAASLRAWQLGETSEGNHLRAAAARYSQQFGDAGYPAAVELFIREEQRHGELIGRFLDQVWIERATADWGDSLFRRARYYLTDMEFWTTPVVMVETLALVYYNAIRRATASAALSAICVQILSDEVPHLRFACERLATLYRRRSRFAFHITMIVHRLLFAGVATLVWLGHRKALRAGGYNWQRYWRTAWDRMNASWRLMEPARYHWS